MSRYHDYEAIHIDPSAFVKNTDCKANVKIWKNTYVKDSIFNENVVIGDFSRIENCIFQNNVNIQRNNLIYSSEIGRYTYTGKNLTCWHSKIGSFCSLSWNVSIGGANHDYTRITTSAFLYSDLFDLKGENNGYERFENYCEIGDDVWIGCGAVICRNVKIGIGAVIAANAVVTKDVEPYTIVAGVPAKKIKSRFSQEITEKLKLIRWWEFPKEYIKNNFELFNSYPTIEILERLMKLRNQLDELKK